MNRFPIGLFGATLILALVAPRPVHAEDATGMRKEMIASLTEAGDKIIELAEATPEAKYAYTPAKGVRSTGSVFMHVVAANYMLPMFFAGKKPPIADDLMKLEEKPPAKARVIEMLKTSFDYAKGSIGEIAEGDLMGEVKTFDGSNVTRASMMLITVSHAHEHLGQSIAYARMNGITPPWTAREMEAAKKAKEASGK